MTPKMQAFFKQERTHMLANKTLRDKNALMSHTFFKDLTHLSLKQILAYMHGVCVYLQICIPFRENVTCSAGFSLLLTGEQTADTGKDLDSKHRFRTLKNNIVSRSKLF